MIKYGDLVEYIKENHINWNTDLFDVLKGFFESYSQKPLSQPTEEPTYQEPIAPKEDYQVPDSVEYTTDMLLDLFSH